MGPACTTRLNGHQLSQLQSIHIRTATEQLFKQTLVTNEFVCMIRHDMIFIAETMACLIYKPIQAIKSCLNGFLVLF